MELGTKDIASGDRPGALPSLEKTPQGDKIPQSDDSEQKKIEAEESESQYPSRLGLVLIAVGLCFVVFLFALVCTVTLQ